MSRHYIEIAAVEARERAREDARARAKALVAARKGR